MCRDWSKGEEEDIVKVTPTGLLRVFKATLLMQLPVRSPFKRGHVFITVAVLQNVHLRKIENKVGKVREMGRGKEGKGEEGQKGDG